MAYVPATETLTVLDDQEAQRAARAWRKTAAYQDNPIPDDHWDLPTAADFKQTVNIARRRGGTRGKTGEPIVAYKRAVESFRNLSHLLTNSATDIETTELLTEVMRSWRIASDPELGTNPGDAPRAAGDPPRWALRSASDRKTTSLRIAFPLCTIRREIVGGNTQSTPNIEVVLAPYRPQGRARRPDDSAFIIVAFFFSPRPAQSVTTTFKRLDMSSQQDAKKRRISPPGTTPHDADVRRIIGETGPLTSNDRDLLASYLASSTMRNNLRIANNCLQHPPSDELRAAYAETILQTVAAAARLDGLVISPAEDALVRTILAGDPLPTVPELTSEAFGLGTADAVALVAAWEHAPATRSYAWHGLAELTAPLPIARAFALVGIYANSGGKKQLKTWLQRCLRDIAERDGGNRVVSWLQQHRTAVRAIGSADEPLRPTEGMLCTALTMASDYRAHEAVSYLETLVDCGFVDDALRTHLALCQVLDGMATTLPAPEQMPARALRMALEYPGITKQLVRRVPAPTAVGFLARIARQEDASRTFLRTAQTVPGMTQAREQPAAQLDGDADAAEKPANADAAPAGTTEATAGTENARAAAASLAGTALAALEPLVAAAPDDASAATAGSATVGDALLAAASLAYLAGSAPTWLQTAIARVAPKTAALDDGAQAALAGFYAIWRAQHADASSDAFVLDALEAGRVRFAAAELANAQDPRERACYEALASLEDLERAATLVTARPTAAGEGQLRHALVRVLTPLAPGVARDAAAGALFATEHAATPARNPGAPALDPTLERAVGMRVITLMAQCFMRQPDCLTPTPDTDPAPFDLLVAYTAHRAADLALVAERGVELVCALVAAGARGSTFRPESALIAHYAQRVLVLNTQMTEVFRRALALSGHHDVASVLVPCILNAGTMAAFRTRCNAFKNFVHAVPLGERKLNEPAAQLRTANATGTPRSRAEERVHELERTHALYRTPLTDLVARFIEDPDLHVGRGDNPGHDLKRALNARHQRRAACVFTLSYVDPWQLGNLAEGIRWVYLENENRSPAALARELPACANLMREYVLGPLVRAAGQSMHPRDDEARQGLTRLGSALVDVVQGIREQGILARGYHQEEAVAALARALAQVAARLAAIPRYDAASITAAATALRDAVAETFPEHADLAGSVASLSTAALVEVFCELITGTDRAPSAEQRELVLAELEHRGAASPSDAQARGIAAWCTELAQTPDIARGTSASLPATTACAVELLRAGARGGGQRTLKPAADALTAARGDAREHVALARLICRYYRTFEIDATWCTITAQKLIDDAPTDASAELFDDFAHMARAAAEEAPAPSRRAILLETAEVARAFAGTAAPAPGSYGAAARAARDNAAAHAPELLRAVTMGALYRHMGLLVSFVATCGDIAAARRAAQAVRPLFAQRPWYVSRTTLKSVYSACEQGDEGVAALETLAAFAAELADPALTALVSDLMQLHTADAEAFALLKPLVTLVQGGGINLAETLASTLAAAGRIDAARAGGPQHRAADAVDPLVRRIARQTLPPVSLIDALQQLALQHQPAARAEMTHGILDEAATAYLILADELTAAHPRQTDTLATAAATLGRTGVTALPRAFQPAARMLLRTAANPSPLRPRYALNGRFEGFVSAQRDAGAQRSLTELVATQSAALIDRALHEAPRDAGAVTTADAADDSLTDDAREGAAARGRDLTALELIDETLDDLAAAEDTDPLSALYLVVAAGLIALGRGETTGELVCGMGTHLFARTVALMRTCLAETPLRRP